MPSAREWWSFGASVYLPSALYGVGLGAITPTVVLSARELGASLATAGLVAALLPLGKVIADVPAGLLATRVGERMAMFVSAGLTLVSLAVMLSATNLAVFGLGVAISGIGSAVWGLARHAYLTETMPPHLRGRALSTLGGMYRIGMFIGPLLGAAAIGPLGLAGAYWVDVVVTVVATVALLAVPDVSRAPGVDTGHHDGADGMVAVVRENFTVLRTLGVGALMINAVRGSRQVLVPLWADHLGLSPTTASLIFGISGAVDTLLFYPSGMALDRFGRRPLVIASLIGLAFAHLLMPLSSDGLTLGMSACLMGLGNGISSGTNMTIGADVSPTRQRATFLGAWRLLSDIGSSAGPIAIGGLATLTALGPATAVLGGVAGVTAWKMHGWLRSTGPGTERPPASPPGSPLD
ncbi:MFS transporter [Nocardioides halotolerans]|uniref:MFS transporter n=1 Tax=Nocardioides halotolerans TaxID=433660 RepID=UPI0004062598|nr:MFS transporter [Nocardioides halotolerans]